MDPHVVDLNSQVSAPAAIPLIPIGYEDEWATELKSAVCQYEVASIRREWN
jgi:hypothetical protein